MDWTALPSLSALRALEAAARTGSLTAAAAELNVTHAAISQHVRKLETHFGVALLSRSGQGVVPTSTALPLCDALSEAFGLVAAAARDLSEARAARPLRVSLTPSLAATWLMPRIAGFWTEHPDIELELLPSNRVVDLVRDGFDLAVRQGRGSWPGVEAEHLMPSPHVVVAGSRSDPVGTLEDLAPLAQCRWLLGPLRTAETQWARAHGLDLDAVRGTEFDDNALLLQALKGSDRVAILPGPVVAREIDEGSVVRLFHGGDEEYGYYMVTRPGPRSHALKAFMRWLRREAVA